MRQIVTILLALSVRIRLFLGRQILVHRRTLVEVLCT
jgi:hypothetical protein